MRPDRPHTARAPWRERLYQIVFESDTAAGRAFDVALIVAILASVAVVALDSIAAIHARYRLELRLAEWTFTLLFTVEYVLRLVVARDAGRYARSFFGVVDLLAILPTYVSLVFPPGRYLLVVRVLRVLRIFRVLKLTHYLGESALLVQALVASRRKIGIFLFAVLTVVTIVGALMYLIEGPAAGFTSIPRAMYWAIVTLSTVGYGDIAPITPLGQFLAAALMIVGYGVIAVPTGIVTVELAQAARGGNVPPETARRAEQARHPADASASPRCDRCGLEGHDADAAHCKRCGTALT